MNYRHIFHAGNPCDVIKHVLLLYALKEHQKDFSALTILDTHAGVGKYALSSSEALRTKEFEQGVIQIQKHADQLAHPIWKLYLDLLKKYPHHYPGSPLLIESQLRKTDTLTCVELHPEDVRQLRKNIKSNVLHNNGYTCISDQSFILIDPPFEDRNEFNTIVEALKKAKGSVLVWYPIKNQQDLYDFDEEVSKLPLRSALKVEFHFFKTMKENRLNGTGLLFVNTPNLPDIEQILTEALPILSFDGVGKLLIELDKNS